MSTTTRLMTAEELFDLPDGYRYELVKGVLLTMSPSGFDHGKVTMTLSDEDVLPGFPTRVAEIFN